jgi:hypothetical protein
MTAIELVVAALGGGIVATGLAAWVGWLRTFETARLQCIGEIDLTVATAQLVEREGTDAGVQWPTGWERYRDVLAIGLAHHDEELFNALEIHLGIAAILNPGGLAYSSEQIEALKAARVRLRGLAPSRLRGVATYGFGYLALRRQRARLAPAETAAQPPKQGA